MTSIATQTFMPSTQTLTYKQRIDKIRKRLSSRLKDRNYYFKDIGWDDCTRGYESSIGLNISDWSYMLKDGTVLPFIRGPNYTDRTLTIPAKNLAIIVGNEKYNNDLNAINFQKYLKEYGKYTPGVPDDLDLSNGTDDELVTIRFIGVLVPTDENGSQEVVPTAYNYQTTSKTDPKNFIGASFHMGVGSRTDGPNTEKVFLVKTNENGSQDNAWFKITDEEKESEEQKKSVASVLGTQSTGIGRNRVQCFQIPRKQVEKVRYRSAGIMQFDSEEGSDGPIFCGSFAPSLKNFSVGNVSFGSSDGTHTMQKLDKYERDNTQNVTFTFAYYWTLPEDGIFEDEAIDTVMDTLDKSYLDMKGEWLGSLVTGEQEMTLHQEKKDAPIKLPKIVENDYLTFNQKVINYPENMDSIQSFPSEDLI